MICRLLLTISLLGVAGCGTNLFQRRTVYVPQGETVRLRESIRRVKVWVCVEGKWEPSTMTIPEGWYALAKKPKQKEGE
jgi:hypothetical protein